MSIASMALPVPGVVERFRDTNDVVLFDITRQTATSLGAILFAREETAITQEQAQYWQARQRVLGQQINALVFGDRYGLIAQHDAWLAEATSLTTPVPAAS